LRSHVSFCHASGASRACSLSDLAAPCIAARRLKRLVRQSPFTANGSRRIEDAAERLVDSFGRREGGRDLWFEENEVAAFAKSSGVLPANAAFHRRKVVLRPEIVILWSICLVHRILVRAVSLVGR